MLLGPDVIQSFTIALLISVVVGTYSTVYIAAPWLIWLKVDSNSFLPKTNAASSGRTGDEPQRKHVMARFERDPARRRPNRLGLCQRRLLVDDGVYRGPAADSARARPNGPRPRSRDLALSDLEPLLALDPAPEFLILGTGARPRPSAAGASRRRSKRAASASR